MKSLLNKSTFFVHLLTRECGRLFIMMMMIIITSSNNSAYSLSAESLAVVRRLKKKLLKMNTLSRSSGVNLLKYMCLIIIIIRLGYMKHYLK